MRKRGAKRRGTDGKGREKKRKERNKCRKEQSWKSVRKRKSVDKKVRG